MRHLIWNLGSSINGSSCPSKRVCVCVYVCVCVHVCVRVCVCTGLFLPPCSVSTGHTHFLWGHTSSLHSAQVSARIKYKISSFWCCNFHRPCLHFRSTHALGSFDLLQTADSCIACIPSVSTPGRATSPLNPSMTKCHTTHLSLSTRPC